MIHEAGSALRVGLIIEDAVAPRWVADCIRAVQESGVAGVVLLVTAKSTGQRPAYDPRHRSWNPLRMDRVYSSLEQVVTTVNPDPTARTEIASLLVDAARIEVQPTRRGAAFDLNQSDLDAIREHRLDAILLFGFGLPPPELTRVARYGVWTYEEYERFVAGATPVGVGEVLERNPITRSRLYARANGDETPITLYESAGPTDDRMAIRTRKNLLLKSSHFAARALRELARLRPESVNDLSHRWNGSPKSASERVGNVRVMTQAVRSGLRFIRDRIRRRLYDNQWAIAYRLGEPSDPFPGELSTYQLLVPPRDRFWADPFPYCRYGRQFIFLEEGKMPRGRGYICVMEVGPNGIVSEPTPILKRDYHLSFPFLFEHERELFMMPEASEAGLVDVYRCTEFPTGWKLECNLFENTNAVDTVIHQHEGRWWLFTAMAPKDVWNVDELCLFHADSPFGPWIPHALIPVVSDVSKARMAGSLYERDGRLYRPAQDCSSGYGSRMKVFEITRLTPDAYQEHEVLTIEPDWTPKAFRTHTLNMSGPLAVVDAMRHIRR